MKLNQILYYPIIVLSLTACFGEVTEYDNCLTYCDKQKECDNYDVIDDCYKGCELLTDEHKTKVLDPDLVFCMSKKDCTDFNDCLAIVAKGEDPRLDDSEEIDSTVDEKP